MVDLFFEQRSCLSCSSVPAGSSISSCPVSFRSFTFSIRLSWSSDLHYTWIGVDFLSRAPSIQQTHKLTTKLKLETRKERKMLRCDESGNSFMKMGWVPILVDMQSSCFITGGIGRLWLIVINGMLIELARSFIMHKSATHWVRSHATACTLIQIACLFNTRRKEKNAQTIWEPLLRFPRRMLTKLLNIKKLWHFDSMEMSLP